MSKLTDALDVIKNLPRSNRPVKRLVMHITIQQGMVNIDSDEIAYSNIRNMYKTGHGHGLQLIDELEQHRELLFARCGKIADSIYELQDALSA